MQREYIKNYLLIAGIVLILIGILVIAMLASPIRYVGIIFLIFAIILITSFNYLKLRNSEDGRLRSRIRDQIRKHQIRK